MKYLLVLQHSYFLQVSHWETGHLKRHLEGKGTGFCWVLASIKMKGKASSQVKSPGDAMQVWTVRHECRRKQVLKGSSQGKEGEQGRRWWEQGRWDKYRGRS